MTRLGTWGWDVIAITKTWLRVGQDWQLNVLGARELIEVEERGGIFHLDQGTSSR